MKDIEETLDSLGQEFKNLITEEMSKKNIAIFIAIAVLGYKIYKLIKELKTEVVAKTEV